MLTVIAGFVFVASVAGMVFTAIWYRRARFRAVSGRIDRLRFNVGGGR